MFTLITGTEQHTNAANYQYRTTRKHKVICAGVVALARTINYHLVCLALIWEISTRPIDLIILNGFFSGLNLPTWRENLDSILKRSYPFVTLSIGYT